MRKLALSLALVLSLGVATSAFGGVIYEDIFYWLPGGATVVNPSNPPVNALVKIQETVYDSEQAPGIVGALLSVPAIHGDDPIPSAPFDLYVYSITNMNYGFGAGGAGNGVSGFNLNYGTVPILAQWAPLYANSAWDGDPGNSGFVPEWDIDANLNGLDGDGIGILTSQTFAGFMVAVPAGTPHGIIGGDGTVWVHTWVGGEQPAGSQADIIYGAVSGPIIPEPATIGLLAIGSLALIRRRK